MEEKKTGKGKTVTIVILLLIIIGLGAYIGYYDFYLKSVEKKEVYTEEEDDSKREMYTSESAKIAEKLDDYLYFANDFSKKDVKEFDNQQLLFFAILNNTNGYDNSYSKDAIAQKIEDYFGDNVTLKFEDIICPVENEVLYKYDEEKGYTMNDDHPGHGGLGYIGGEAHIINGTVKDHDYTVKARILYTEEGTFTNGSVIYYPTYEDLEKHNPIITEETKERTYRDVESFLPITSFTFTKKGNNYYLKSVKLES